MELKNIQGQYNTHLLQNELYKENMNQMLRVNNDQKINGFIGNYGGSAKQIGQLAHQEIAQQDVMDIINNPKETFIKKSKSEPMRLYGRSGLEPNDALDGMNTAQFNVPNGVRYNNNSSAKYGTLEAESNFVPLKFFDKNQMNPNEFTLGKLKELRFSKNDFEDNKQ